MSGLGLYFLIGSILYTRESIFPWHFLKTAKFLAKSRDLGLILLKMSASGWRTATVFFNSVKKVSSREAYVFYIAERTWEFVDHTVLINQRVVLVLTLSASWIMNKDLEVAHPRSGSSSTWILVELEVGNVGFWWEGKSGVPGEKPLAAKERSNNKLNLHARTRVWTRAALVGGECTHHCATLAPSLRLVRWAVEAFRFCC